MLITRRTKFLIFTIVYIFGALTFEYSFIDKLTYIIFFTLIILLLNLLALYPGYRAKDLFYISYEPLVITVSTLLGLLYFPNLNFIFKILLILISGFLLYISTLTNNLTIAEKVEESSLPLFRVGLIWTQILLIIQTIPMITVIYKINLNFYYQSFLIFLFLLISSFSYLHNILLTKEKGEVSRREYLLIAIQMAFIPTLSSIATSFISTESFLRATLITSAYMGMVGYIRNYFENSITKKLVLQYSLIFVFFIAVVLFYRN